MPSRSTMFAPIILFATGAAVVVSDNAWRSLSDSKSLGGPPIVPGPPIESMGFESDPMDGG